MARARSMSSRRWTPAIPARAFSSEADAGSREENASKQKPKAPFRFYENGKGSRAFSSKADAGSREENASKQKPKAPFRFHRNGKGSRRRVRSPENPPLAATGLPTAG